MKGRNALLDHLRETGKLIENPNVPVLHWTENGLVPVEEWNALMARERECQREWSKTAPDVAKGPTAEAREMMKICELMKGVPGIPGRDGVSYGINTPPDTPLQQMMRAAEQAAVEASRSLRHPFSGIPLETTGGFNASDLVSRFQHEEIVGRLVSDLAKANEELTTLRARVSERDASVIQAARRRV